MQNMLKTVAVVISAILVNVTSAFAAPTITPYGGANWSDVSITKSASSDVGYVAGVTIMDELKTSVPGISIGGDLSYRYNELSKPLCKGILTGDDETVALLADVKYAPPNVAFMGLHPYVMGGVGIGKRYLGGQAETGFASQVGAGITTNVTEDIQVGVGYRYFDAPDITSGPFQDSGANHSLVVEASFKL